ncbi:hypothetical protein KJ682_05615 [bacterium]|nr:hypothetical protein [bacterium]
MRRLTASVCLAALVLMAASAPAAVPTFMWSDDHDGGGLFTDDGFRILSDPVGHAVVAGESADGVGGIDLAIRKLDRTDGHEIWQSRYEGYDDKDVAVTDMTWDSVGQLIVAGYIRGCVG